MKNSPFLKSIKKISIIFFALIGLIFAGVFFAMRFGLLNVSGSIEDRNKFFTEIDQKKVLNNQMVDTQRTIVDCESKVISKYNQILGTNILYLWDKKEDVNLTAQMINNAVIQIQKINPEVNIELDYCS